MTAPGRRTPPALNRSTTLRLRRGDDGPGYAGPDVRGLAWVVKFHAIVSS